MPGTVALLADEGDFAAMRPYRTFAFDDHPGYLRQVEGLLRSLAGRGLHTRLAVFDPDEFALFCAEERPRTGLRRQPDPLHGRGGRAPAPPSPTTAGP